MGNTKISEEDVVGQEDVVPVPAEEVQGQGEERKT